MLNRCNTRPFVWLNALLQFARYHLIYGNGLHPGCTTLDLGLVTIAYSIDHGVTWHDWHTYELLEYR